MIRQSFKMAWKAIYANKMRSFLTMLGIIIGVTSLVVLVSLVSGATSSVTDTIASLNNSTLRVSILDDKNSPLTLSEVMAWTEEEEFGLVVPTSSANGTAKQGATNERISLTGTTPGYYDVEGLTLAHGRFLNQADLNSNTYVAIINSYAAQTLFGEQSVVGESFLINGVEFRIIGVLKAEESNFGFNTDSLEAYLPYTTLMRLSNNVSSVTSFNVSPASVDQLAEAEAALTSKLLSRLEYDTEAFSIFNLSSMAEAMEEVAGILSFMLGGIAAISLVVGGIGIMNIMLASVTERTKEIGIRKAIGASYGNIMSQFMIEAILISLIGCAIGVVFAGGIIEIVSMMSADLSFSLSLPVVILAVAFSACVGVVFGSYPASKAAKKSPVDALRA